MSKQQSESKIFTFLHTITHNLKCIFKKHVKKSMTILCIN